MEFGNPDGSYSSSERSYSDKPPEKNVWPFHSIGKPDTVLVPREETCQKLSFLLGKVDEQGEYSFTGAASSLPDVSGFSVDGMGTVPLPLNPEITQEFVSKEQENVWTLSPTVVQFKNPLWDVGMATLSALSAQRLGFNGVLLQPMLSKVVIIAAGGHVSKHQDALFERCVATLVVQLPSEFTGGDLMVYEEEIRSEVRYELGKNDASAPFKPHFAVYSAGAYCAVEEVTSGHCVMMIYSLWLPHTLPIAVGRANRNLIRLQLAENMKLFKGGPDDEDLSEDTVKDVGSTILALMLSRSCTQTDIESEGVNALPVVDLHRFQFLREANIFLEPGKKLIFYLVRLRYRAPILGNEQSAVNNVAQDMTWYSISGAKIDGGQLHDSEWATKLNFLNPANETLSQLWESGERNTCAEHARFAVIGWPASADITNAVALFGEVSSVPVILAHSFISPTTLRMLLNRDGSGFTQTLKMFDKSNMVVELLPLCLKLGGAIIDLGETTLLQAFFKKYATQLKEKDKQLFFQWLRPFVRVFGWANVSTFVLNFIDTQSTEIRLDRALELADALNDNAAAVTALVMFAAKKARAWCSSHADAFVSSGKVAKLLTLVTTRGSPQIFASLSAVLNKIDGSLLHTVIDALSKSINESSTPEQRALLASLATRRREWLRAEIEDTKRPLTWGIPDMNFPGAGDIALFLKGPGASFTISGYSGIGDARKRAKVLQQKIDGSVKVVADGRGKSAFVQILKVGGDFDTRRKDVPKYQSEIDHLDHILGEMLPQDENTNTFNVGLSGRKRHREDESDIK